MRNQLPPRCTEILNALSESKQSTMSTKDIVSISGRSYSSVTKDIRMLVKLKCLRKIAAPEGHQFYYKYLTHDAKWPEPKNKKGSPSVDHVPMDASVLMTQLYNWADTGWNPNVRNKIWLVSSVLGKLMEYDALSAIHGEQISQGLIDEQREKLTDLYNVLSQSLNSVGRMLATEGLWSSSTLQGFFTQFITDVSREKGHNEEELLTKAKTIQSYQTINSNG